MGLKSGLLACPLVAWSAIRHLLGVEYVELLILKLALSIVRISREGHHCLVRERVHLGSSSTRGIEDLRWESGVGATCETGGTICNTLGAVIII
jgi:hypothetical protein